MDVDQVNIGDKSTISASISVEKANGVEADKRLDGKQDQTSQMVNGSEAKMTAHITTDDDVVMIDSEVNDSLSENEPQEETPNVWHPALIETIREAKEILPSDAWHRGMSPQFYTTFWQLGLYDIEFPEKEYNSTLDKINARINEYDSQKKKQKERDKYCRDKIELEKAEHSAHMKRVRERIEKEKNYWFPGSSIFSPILCSLV